MRSIFKISNPNNPLADFNRIAKSLFREYRICTGENEYLFTEIEFYFQTEAEADDAHHDPFTHGQDLQKSNGQWYFHWSGIDITIGNGTDCGGILIRGIKPVDKPEEYISGPLNVMRELMSQDVGVFDQKGPELYLERITDTNYLENEIWRARRVGLTAKPDKDPDNVFFNSRYRYLIDAKNPKHGYKAKMKVLEGNDTL